MFFNIVILVVHGISQQSTRRPNVLILHADEWRAQATGYSGDKNVKVPNLDRLAASSANFARAVSGLPVCIRKGTYNAMINSEDIMPTLLGLTDLQIPITVEGKDFSKYMRDKAPDPKDTAALITCIHPFGQWIVSQGGKEFRGIRTPRYTYVRDRNGPWLLYDNTIDPYQMKNLSGNKNHSVLQARLDKLLLKKLEITKDEFLPGLTYVKKYTYPALDSSQTVPYYGANHPLVNQ